MDTVKIKIFPSLYLKFVEIEFSRNHIQILGGKKKNKIQKEDKVSKMRKRKGNWRLKKKGKEFFF